MTENECINKIQWRIDIASAISGDGKDGKAFEDLEVAIKALEKQIPNKPIETPTDDTCLYHENYCPICEKMLIVKYKHCPSCGQKLDWKTE